MIRFLVWAIAIVSLGSDYQFKVHYSNGYICVLSHVWLCNSTDCSHQAPLSIGFSRQEYRSELPFPPPGDLPEPGLKPVSFMSPAFAGGFFTTEPPGKPDSNDCLYCQSMEHMLIKANHGQQSVVGIRR